MRDKEKGVDPNVKNNDGKDHCRLLGFESKLPTNTSESPMLNSLDYASINHKNRNVKSHESSKSWNLTNKMDRRRLFRVGIVSILLLLISRVHSEGQSGLIDEAFGGRYAESAATHTSSLELHDLLSEGRTKVSASSHL